MKEDSVQSKLRESLWRRDLTAAEEVELRTWLAAHPEARAEWAAETALSEGLRRLPNASVPSNFTARVVRALEQEAAQSSRALGWRWSWRVLVPRLAMGVAVLGLAGLAYQRHEYEQRARLARSVAVVTESQPLPSMEALKNFDAIRRMSQTEPHADNELLSLLQ